MTARVVGPEDDLNWSYSGSNSNAPTIMVFRPTWEEFKDFNAYLAKIESIGAHEGGLAKIIPPKEWVPRKKGYNLEDLFNENKKITDPISQVVTGTKGLYQSINVKSKGISVRDFYKKACKREYSTPIHTDFEDLERKYWKNVTFVNPLYGADVPGSITDKECKEWNIQKLGSCLDWIHTDYKVKLKGVNTAYLYWGMWKTTFAWHTEDMDLHSINYLHYGQSKFWYTIPPSYARRFERLVQGLFPNLYKECPSFLRHKMCLISPNILRQNSIPYNKIVQREGEFMITFPLGYHSGFNTGFNIAESTNFATERWVEYGKRCKRCYCRPDNVHISMDTFVKRLQPERYEDWLKGQDYGRHPEEPNANPTPAPPPSAEEYMTIYKDKKVPIELLEPSTKKRRHPIHKKTNSADSDNEISDFDLKEEKKLKQSPVLNLKRIDETVNLNVNKSLLVPKLKEEGPKLSFTTHPSFGTLPTKNDFGNGLMANNWPSSPSSNQQTMSNQVKMSESAKQKWIQGFTQPTPNQIRPPASQYYPVRPPSLTATISKLQNNLYNNSLPKTTSIPPTPSDDLQQRQAGYPEELRRVLQSTGILKETTVEVIRPQHQVVISNRIIQNRNILASNVERPIISHMIMIDRSTWHPPYAMPMTYPGFQSPWHLKSSVNVFKGEMYVRFDGPQNIKRSFCLQFTNILGTSRRHQKGDSIWPPSDRKMDLCDDLRHWSISASVDPYTDIKATVTDPWNKSYLLTIPIKLCQS